MQMNILSLFSSPCSASTDRSGISLDIDSQHVGVIYGCALTLLLLRRSDALKRQDGNFAAGFALVFGKTRHHLDHFGVKLAAFGLSGRGGTDLEALGANLDGRDRVGQQVVVPVGIAGRAAFGGDD